MVCDAKIGYQATRDEFFEACKSSSKDKDNSFCGCIDVDDSTPCVNKLLGTVCILIRKVNETMWNFIHIFGIDEGKGLSSF